MQRSAISKSNARLAAGGDTCAPLILILGLSTLEWKEVHRITVVNGKLAFEFFYTLPDPPAATFSGRLEFFSLTI
jgi:hypothetical protein